MMHSKRPLSINSSAAIIGGNNDLLMEILLFVPARSLVRFKAVSKHWRSLISAPSFSRLHILRRRRPEPQTSFIHGGITLKFFICHPTIKKLVPFSFPFLHVKILQSCNGLLLLECKSSPRWPHGRKEYHVFNPTTKQSRNLFLKRSFSGLCSIFDPSKSHHLSIVCSWNVGNSTSFLVYDSRTHSWEDGGNFHTRQRYKVRDEVYWKGGLYFIRFGRCCSFRFCLQVVVHSVHNPPRVESRRVKKSYIMESNGHMHYVVLSLQPVKNRIFVLEMNDDESGWCMKFRVDLSPISATFAADKGTSIDLLGMIRREKEEDSVLLFHVPGKIMIYRFADEVFEVLVEFTSENYYREGRLQFGFKDACPFIDSLAHV